VKCHKVQIMVVINRFLEHDEFTKLKWLPQSPDLNRVPLGGAGTGDPHHGFRADKSAVTV